MGILLNCDMGHNATYKPLLAFADLISLVAEWYVNEKKKKKSLGRITNVSVENI